MKKQSRSLIEIHIAVFLFGFSALFGKLITLSPTAIVFGRTSFATLALLIFLLYSKQNFKLKSKKDFLFLFSVGFIYAFHWYSFFKSVQISNVAIAVLTFSTYPIFVTFLEPYFFNEKIRTFDIISALVTLFGVLLVVPKFELTNNFTQGALWGIAAGFSCALLAIACKVSVAKYSSIVVSFYQNLATAIISIPLIILIKPVFEVKNLFLLAVLGILFTAISGTLYIKSLSNIKVQLASIITCLEPVYAIIFAAIFLKEVPSTKTIFGGLIILGAIISATLKSKSITIVPEH
ncbi:MAG: EamA family transporter [Candidatus Melainabacteria bacterium]|nr:EamA family transporter [Candidatus Melainabacteria bacterium]